MKPGNVIKFISSILICALAGFLGSVFTTPSIWNWYAALNKPPLQPPNWIFGPVWTLLYIMMAISLYIIWANKTGSKDRQYGLYAFSVQLALNSLWSILFFGAHLPLLSFIEVILLWASILATIIYFRRVSNTAAWLLVPYILWVSFASYLNLGIWLLNR